MTDPIEEALAWLETALMCELEGEEVEAARHYMVQATDRYDEMKKEVERLRIENAAYKSAYPRLSGRTGPA